MDAILSSPDAGYLLRDPLAMRQRFLDRAVPAIAPAARQVGLKAYLQAGGSVTQNFFDQTRLNDPELLARLEKEKLSARSTIARTPFSPSATAGALRA